MRACPPYGCTQVEGEERNKREERNKLLSEKRDFLAKFVDAAAAGGFLQEYEPDELRVQIDMCVDMWLGMTIDMCADICVDICVDMCADMRLDIRIGIVRGSGLAEN